MDMEIRDMVVAMVGAAGPIWLLASVMMRLWKSPIGTCAVAAIPTTVVCNFVTDTQDVPGVSAGVSFAAVLVALALTRAARAPRP